MHLSPTRLRELRTAAGFSRELAGIGSGRTGHSITNYELGRSKPDADVLAKLAELYDCELTDFYESDPSDVDPGVEILPPREAGKSEVTA